MTFDCFAAITLRLLGIHHKIGTQNGRNQVTSVNVFSNEFYRSKQHLLNVGQQYVLLHSNLKNLKASLMHKMHIINEILP